MCAMVLTESVTFWPGDPAGSDEGVKAGLVFAGKPEVVNEMALPKVPPEADVATANVKLPGRPATTEDDEDGADRLKSGTRIGSEELSPPAGGGLNTVTLRMRLELPELTKSPAGICAESDVALAKVVVSGDPLT